MTRPLMVLATVAAVSGCTAPEADDGATTDTGTQNGTGGTGGTKSGDAGVAAAAKEPTYYGTIAPLLAGHCVGCHNEKGAMAMMPFTTYENAKKFSAQIVANTRTTKMPPWGAVETAECKPRLSWQGDLHLKASEIDLFKQWRDNGSPAGDATKSAALPGQVSPHLSRTDVDMAPNNAYTPPQDQSKDDLHCFILDPKLLEDKYMIGVDVVPGNAGVVHHAAVYVDPNRVLRTIKGDDGQLLGPGADYFCGGSDLTSEEQFRVDPNQLSRVLLWTPGQGATEFAPDIGMKVAKNSLVLLRIHYHYTPSHPGADKTRVQMKFSQTKPKWTMLPVVSIGNSTKSGSGLLSGPDDPSAGPAFTIPAESTTHTETMVNDMPSWAVPKGGYIYMVNLHMHYVGVEMKMEIERKTPTAAQPAKECLGHIPKWDFNWQRNYVYKGPVESLPFAAVGDKFRIRCTYNNSMSNPDVAKGLAERGLSAPTEVVLGERTIDEMCLTHLGFLVPTL